MAVVDDADELAAAGFDLDTNARGAGVEGVFEELFDYGCGAFDDFARGDLIGDLVGKYVNLAHGLIVVSLAGKSLTRRFRREPHSYALFRQESGLPGSVFQTLYSHREHER